jgi:methylmalonyl-CoA mutase
MPFIGVNTFREPHADTQALDEGGGCLELARATPEEKESQLQRLSEFQKAHETEAPGALKRLQEAALSGQNVFAEMMNAVRCCSLGQITQALYDVGGKYRRNM